MGQPTSSLEDPNLIRDVAVEAMVGRILKETKDLGPAVAKTVHFIYARNSKFHRSSSPGDD
jgi:hypothetical protein